MILENNRMKLCLLGDVALFGRCSIAGSPDWKTYFADVADYLKSFDYVVGNLETPFSRTQKTHGAKSAYLCSDVENIEILRYLNIDAVNLANNHMFDYGSEGYETTKRLLAENGIEYFGSEGRELKLEIADNKLAFSGFCCYSTNPLHTVRYGKYGINELNYQTVLSVMKGLNQQGYLNIVSIHTGIEHVNFPDRTTVRSARKLAAEMDYVFYGHHPHVSQGIEKIDGSLLAYSLGNFCFDDVYSLVSDKPLVELSDNNRSSFLLSIEIHDNKIKAYDILPIYIGKDRIYLGKGTVSGDLDRYSKKLEEIEGSEYLQMRSSLINEYYGNRKSKRDLRWVLQRLRPRYVRLTLDMIINKIKYKKNINEL